MTKLYSARWVLPISSEPIEEGAILVDEDRIVAVGEHRDLSAKFPGTQTIELGEAAILPGLINTHSHLELTVMRGFLEGEESNFFAWLKKLTRARLERLTTDDLLISASWGACEAARAGVTCVGDASDSASQSMTALRDVGLRGIVYQESFGPDPKLANENFDLLRTKVAALRELETSLVAVGVSPHAPYTVCAPQLEMISDFALAETLPVMMHAAESQSEKLLLSESRGPFAEGYVARGIEWSAPSISSIQYLANHGILRTKPLLAHCITVDESDIQTIKESGAGIAHCPKSNSKLGHGRAPFEKFLQAGVPVGLGSDSVASNNICDLLEEARFAVLSARASNVAVIGMPSAKEALAAATAGGAKAMGLADRIGVLEPGQQADFAAISLRSVHQRPVYDPYSALIFASSARDVVLTVVAGKEIYRDGRMTAIDEERIAARIEEIQAKLTGV
jgi:cytosine/adenosine deaminase-related metal-dependent hydrolase